MDADWEPLPGDPAEARAVAGNLVAITPSATFAPEVCGIKIAAGVSVLAEVSSAGARSKVLPDGSVTRVCDVVTMGGPLDADGGVDRVFSAPSHRVMGMLAMACADRVEVPISELQLLPPALSGEHALTEVEKAARAENTRAIRSLFTTFRSGLPRERTRLQTAAAAAARASELERLTRTREVVRLDPQPAHQPASGYNGGRAPFDVNDPNHLAPDQEDAEESIHPSLLRNKTRSISELGDSQLSAGRAAQRRRTAYEADLAAQVVDTAAEGRIVSHLQLATTLGRSGIVDAGTPIRWDGTHNLPLETERTRGVSYRDVFSASEPL